MVVDVPFTLEVTPVPPVPSFRGEVDPVAQTVPAGTVATYRIRALGDPGFVAAIALSVIGLPDNAAWSFDADTIFAGEEAILTIVAPEGSYSLLARMTEVEMP